MVISKSAYSVAGKIEKIEGHTIVVWVDNEAGVLARVVGFFSGRGYNIDSLVVAEVDKKKQLIQDYNCNLGNTTSNRSN